MADKPATSTEKTALPPADRLEIQDLYGRYSMLVDDGDAAGWSMCFIADGRFVVPEFDLEIVGREQLAAYSQEHMQSPRAAVHHHVTSMYVEPSPGGAAGRAYAMEIFGLQVVSSIRYDDELIKDDGVWRFAKREVTVSAITTVPTPEHAAAR